MRPAADFLLGRSVVIGSFYCIPGDLFHGRIQKLFYIVKIPSYVYPHFHLSLPAVQRESESHVVVDRVSSSVACSCSLKIFYISPFVYICLIIDRSHFTSGIKEFH